MAKRNQTKIYIVIWTLLLIWGSTIQADDPLVIVVNSSSTLSDISTDELKRLYLGKTTILSDGNEVLLMAHTPNCELFYKTVLDMTPREVRRHWMKLVFEGAFATPPEEYSHIRELITRVCLQHGAIGFLPLSEVDSCLKVLALDGKLPENEGYPLK